jgi:hypothetical protein
MATLLPGLGASSPAPQVAPLNEAYRDRITVGVTQAIFEASRDAHSDTIILGPGEIVDVMLEQIAYFLVSTNDVGSTRSIADLADVVAGRLIVKIRAAKKTAERGGAAPSPIIMPESAAD